MPPNIKKIRKAYPEKDKYTICECGEHAAVWGRKLASKVPAVETVTTPCFPDRPKFCVVNLKTLKEAQDRLHEEEDSDS